MKMLQGREDVDPDGPHKLGLTARSYAAMIKGGVSMLQCIVGKKLAYLVITAN